MAELLELVNDVSKGSSLRFFLVEAAKKQGGEKRKESGEERSG